MVVYFTIHVFLYHFVTAKIHAYLRFESRSPTHIMTVEKKNKNPTQIVLCASVIWFFGYVEIWEYDLCIHIFMFLYEHLKKRFYCSAIIAYFYTKCRITLCIIAFNKKCLKLIQNLIKITYL